MEGSESYMHYYAKEIVRSWLISASKYNRAHGYPNNLYIFSWAGDDTHHGIRLEYPILSTQHAIIGVDPCWTTYPDLDHLGAGVEVTAVLDIAILDGGRLKYGIEIVHKHICSAKKRKALNAIPDIKVYELSAEWVLCQLRNIVPPKLWPLVPII